MTVLYSRCGLREVVAAALLGLVIAGVFVTSASGSVAAPGWEVSPGVYPSSIVPGGNAQIMLPIYNVGGAASNDTLTVTDKLPPGLTATEAGFRDFRENALVWKCTLGSVVSCVNDPEELASIPPGEMYFLEIVVKASEGVSGSALNEVTVSGGGALAPATAVNTITFGSAPQDFGLQTLDGWLSDTDGTLDVQAGSHPYSLTVSFFFNNLFENQQYPPVGEGRDVVVSVPPGLVGNPQAVPRCTRSQLNAELCPADTQIGVDRVAGHGPEPGLKIIAPQLPVYNMVPPPGVPAQFGLSIGVSAPDWTLRCAAVATTASASTSKTFPNARSRSIRSRCGGSQATRVTTSSAAHAAAKMHRPNAVCR